METLLAVIITAIIGPILVIITTHFLNKRKKSVRPMIEALETNSLVDYQIDIIMDLVKADRIWISQFHNGGNFYPTGKSIQKFSVFYEHIVPGIETVQDSFTNVPVSLFNKSFMVLYKEGEIIIPSYNNEEFKNYGLDNYSDEFDTKSTYIFCLKTIDGDFLGTLGVDFCNEEKYLEEGDINALRTKASVIGTILSTYLYQNPKTKLWLDLIK